jgi:hypothetical protein
MEALKSPPRWIALSERRIYQALRQCGECLALVGPSENSIGGWNVHELIVLNEFLRPLLSLSSLILPPCFSSMDFMMLKSPPPSIGGIVCFH